MDRMLPGIETLEQHQGADHKAARQIAPMRSKDVPLRCRRQSNAWSSCPRLAVGLRAGICRKTREIFEREEQVNSARFRSDHDKKRGESLFNSFGH